MGTPGMAPGTPSSFVFGGYVVHERHVQRVVQSWRRIKRQICGTADVELKWKHFFVDADDDRIGCPILEKNPQARRLLAQAALDQLFQQSPIIPLVAVSRKDRASDAFIVESKKGKPKLDHDLMWVGPVGLFAVFLQARRARGRLWFDQLGSEKHQARWQAAWSEQLRTIRDGECHPESADNLRKLLAIIERIEFFDSTKSEAVQVADFVCGVIWQAAEGDEAYLARLLDAYGPDASRQGLGIVHLE